MLNEMNMFFLIHDCIENLEDKKQKKREFFKTIACMLYLIYCASVPFYDKYVCLFFAKIKPDLIFWE